MHRRSADLGQKCQALGDRQLLACLYDEDVIAVLHAVAHWALTGLPIAAAASPRRVTKAGRA